MPSVKSHIVIAERLRHDASAEYLFGSALPDFIGMYRDYRQGNITSLDFAGFPDTAEGIRIHNLSDKVFDSLPEVVTTRSQMIKEMLDSDQPISRGAARACAAIAFDVLVDTGVAVDIKKNVDPLERVKRYAAGKHSVLTKIPGVGFQPMVEDYFDQNASKVYKEDPERLATMMYFRFMQRRRQRLAFNEEAIPHVTRVIASNALSIRRMTEVIIDKTVSGVSLLRTQEN